MSVSIPQCLDLEEKEAKLYLALLELGEATATVLSKKTGVYRTLIYQLTDKMIDRGIVAFVIKNNVRWFRAADPESLLKTLQEKAEQFHAILPNLKARQKVARLETKVDVYRGKEGISTILRMILRNGKPYYLIGGADEACTIFELQNKAFVRQAERLKLNGYILGRKKDRFFVGKNEEYRFVPDYMISSTTMVTWGDKTAVFVWSEPYYAIVIESEEVAKSNLATFGWFWSHARKPTQNDRKRRLLRY